MKSKLFTVQGEQVILKDKSLGKGGEGEVHEIASPSKYRNNCVKIYFNPTEAHEKKIRFMVDNPPEIIHGSGFMIGWPVNAVYHEKKKFVGFIMPMSFRGSVSLYQLTLPVSRRLDYTWNKFARDNGRLGLISRLKLMKNLAIPIHFLHKTGKYVLKDFKPQNVLVTNVGEVAILDMDSVQISDHGKLLYPATVATAEYIPPEAYTQGIGTDKESLIDVSWDNFAFSVVFYQLLFGLHPYVVTPKYINDDSSNTIQENISMNLFPFGANASKVKKYPELHEKFKVLPDGIKNLFKRAFSKKPIDRPGADEWGKLLHEIIVNLPDEPIVPITPPRPPSPEPRPQPRPTPTPPPPPPPPSPSPREKKWVAVLVAIIVFLILLFVRNFQ